MYRDADQTSPASRTPTPAYRSLGDRCLRFLQGWLCHRRLRPQQVSDAVAVLVSRRERFAALVLCERAQLEQPQNVHAYLYAIALAIRCHKRQHRANLSYARGMQTLSEPRDRELLKNYFTYAETLLRS